MCDSKCGREGERLRTDLQVRPYGMADRSERMAAELNSPLRSGRSLNISP